MPIRHGSPTLPRGNYFMITMQIAESFGGLTAAMLERARVFSDVAQVPTTVVTVDPRPTYAPVQQRLIDEGRITPSVNMLNFHEELRSRTGDPKARRLDPNAAGEGTWELDDGGFPFCLTREEPHTGLVTTLTYTRADGSIYLEEFREHDVSGKRTSRRFIRHEATGTTPYPEAGSLYRAWFDEVKGEGPSYVIVDSKFSAIHFGPYERPDTYKFHVLHGYHAVDAGHPLTGALTRQRRPFLTTQERWDGVVTLTDRNRQDLEERFGPANNRFVVTNIVPRVPRYPAFSKRSTTRGVMVARLAPVKDIPRAMRIIKKVHQQDPRVTLDIYGGGPDAEALEDLRTSMGLDGVVNFHGPTPQAAQHFDTAAFTLLTSRSEMQPLVLMEAMGRGCPAIALDIRYGPKDLIKHGITGFLIPGSSEKWAAHSVLRAMNNRLRARLVSRMAWRQSNAFGVDAALHQWATAFNSARRQSSGRILFNTLLLLEAKQSGQGRTASLRIPLDMELSRGIASGLEFSLVWVDRESGESSAAPGNLHEGEVIVECPLPTADLARNSTEPLDAYLQIQGNNVARRLRVPLPEQGSIWRHEGRVSYRTVNGFLSFKST
ncbi:glycosyltransferase [Arthrobacter rhombi]|uniref:glycosyltransferase n=1 Tax=Arthrobacter rhombi TaxID=71253 RepID=UPI003FD66435